LKKALTQQTLEMTEIRETMRQVDADLAEAREDAANARAAADAWKARLEEAEEAKRKAAEEMAESERQAKEAQARAAEQSKASECGWCDRIFLTKRMTTNA
jgi:chromosome segregation ATPase